MVKKGFSIILLSLICGALSAIAAEPYRRLVNFEWDPIEGARKYEVELQQSKSDGNGKKFSFKVKNADWNGRLTPGKYIMRLRSFDYRNVPGEWSDASDFNVGLDPVKLEAPAANSKISSNENENLKMDFRWKPVDGAERYTFSLVGEDGQVLTTETTSSTNFSTKVPVAQNYTWKVLATNAEGVESEAVSVAPFTLMGKAIEKPTLKKPESEFVREVSWRKTEKTESYDVYVLKLNETGRKWEKYQVFEDYKDNTLVFNEQWPGGKYQVAVRAKSPRRPSSPLVKETFSVRNGDRSPAAEYTALVRKSIERLSGWYGIASYLITQMEFAGSNPEKNSSTAYSAMGGTGRMGLGWFDSEKDWGFLGILDMSGFTFNGKTQTFASMELSAVYRKSLGDRGEFRAQMGPYYKELPETIGDPFTGVSEDQIISSIGAHFGGEYWYSLTPKLGIQLNAHSYMSLMKVHTPNGEPLAPSLSTQFGFLGSYRFTPTFTGLLGYAHREDRMSYNAIPGAGNFAEAGDVNESTIVGDYLNFFAEWSF